MAGIKVAIYDAGVSSVTSSDINYMMQGLPHSNITEHLPMKEGLKNGKTQWLQLRELTLN